MTLTFPDQLTSQFWSFICHSTLLDPYGEIVGIPDYVDNYLKIAGAPGSVSSRCLLQMSMR